MQIRPATVEDAAAIADIYNREVLESTVTFDIEPRSLAEQEAWLRDRSGAHAVLVAELDGAVVGFASLSSYRDRAAYRTSVEDSIYLHRDFRGRGIAKPLLSELLDLATRHGFHAVFAKIVGDHEASIRLHEALGFEKVGTEREVGRKFGRWLDVVLLEKLLSR